MRTRFDGRWVSGYRVASVAEGVYVLARVSDGMTLPASFGGDEVRPAICAPA